jgi:hypothetical protein
MGGGAMMDRENITHGTPEAYREFIRESLTLAQLYADLAATHAAIGDDVALGYSLKCLVAYLRAATAVFKDLKNMKATHHE